MSLHLVLFRKTCGETQLTPLSWYPFQSQHNVSITTQRSRQKSPLFGQAARGSVVQSCHRCTHLEREGVLAAQRVAQSLDGVHGRHVNRRKQLLVGRCMVCSLRIEDGRY